MTAKKMLISLAAVSLVFATSVTPGAAKTTKVSDPQGDTPLAGLDLSRTSVKSTGKDLVFKMKTYEAFDLLEDYGDGWWATYWDFSVMGVTDGYVTMDIWPAEGGGLEAHISIWHGQYTEYLDITPPVDEVGGGKVLRVSVPRKLFGAKKGKTLKWRANLGYYQTVDPEAMCYQGQQMCNDAAPDDGWGEQKLK